MSTAPPPSAAVFVLSAAEPLRGMEKAAADTVSALRTAGLDVGTRVVAWEHSFTRERAAFDRGFALVGRLVLPLYRRRADAVVALAVPFASLGAVHLLIRTVVRECPPSGTACSPRSGCCWGRASCPCSWGSPTPAPWTPCVRSRCCRC